MKPQAAPIIHKPVHDPLPPVIVKMGGGAEPHNDVPINIGPPEDLPLDSRIEWTVINRASKAPVTWTRARTTRNGRIYVLTVQDPTGKDRVLCSINNQAEALTTLNFYFASNQDTFEVSEVAENGSIHMEAASNRSFDARDPTPDDRWTSSNATFLSPLVKVELRQRKIGSEVDFLRYEYVIDSDFVSVNLDYRQS
jgi:hypothetical protein